MKLYWDFVTVGVIQGDMIVPATKMEWFLNLDEDEMQWKEEIKEEIALDLEEQYPGRRLY